MIGDVVTLDVTDSTATEVAVNVTTTLDDKAILGMAIEIGLWKKLISWAVRSLIQI